MLRSWLCVEDFVARARALPNDAKARSFKEAIGVVLELGREGRGSGKAVVFTESITTQEYIRRLLLDMGLQDEEITLFRGANDTSAPPRPTLAGCRRKDVSLAAGHSTQSRGRGEAGTRP